MRPFAWEMKIVKSLPKELRGSLPAIAELEKEFTRKKRDFKRISRKNKAAPSESRYKDGPIVRNRSVKKSAAGDGKKKR